MRKSYGAVIALAVVLLGSAFGLASPITVNLYADSAPNVYGSPDWDPWWANTKSDVVSGAFTNMRTGTYPGTLVMDPYDEIVYSTGDLGKRLHWIYWVPETTIDDLKDMNFQVKFVIDWDSVAYTYDWDIYKLVPDGPEVGWVTPRSWQSYEGGVIGTWGHAWWATDDDAPPYDTGGSAYDETNQADIDAVRQLVFQYQTYATGMVRWQENGQYQTESLTVTVVPEPATLSLFGVAVAGAALLRRRRKA